MTTVIWNRARDAQRTYKAQPPRELLAPPEIEDRPACKTCGYVVHKPTCPAIQPADPVQVERKVWVPGFGKAPGVWVPETLWAPENREDLGSRAAVWAPEKLPLSGLNSVTRGDAEVVSGSLAALHDQIAEQRRMYSADEYEKMRQGLLQQVMVEKTIANNAALLLEHKLVDASNGYLAAQRYQQQSQALRSERQALQHQVAMLEMERDRMKTKPDYMWREDRGDWAAVRYGTEADEVRLEDRIKQAYAAQQLAREQTAQAQQLIDMARALQSPMNADQAASLSKTQAAWERERQSADMARLQENLKEDRRRREIAKAVEAHSARQLSRTSELDRYRALVHGDADAMVREQAWLNRPPGDPKK